MTKSVLSFFLRNVMEFDSQWYRDIVKPLNSYLIYVFKYSNHSCDLGYLYAQNRVAMVYKDSRLS